MGSAVSLVEVFLIPEHASVLTPGKMCQGVDLWHRTPNLNCTDNVVSTQHIHNIYSAVSHLVSEEDAPNPPAPHGPAHPIGLFLVLVRLDSSYK